MKTRKLKNIAIFILAIFSIIVCCLFDCTSHIDFNNGGERSVTKISQSGDFSLELTVNKTIIRVGNTIAVSATFKNLSGKDLYILGAEDLFLTSFDDTFCDHPYYEDAKLKDYMSFLVHPKKGNYAYISIWTGPYNKTILKKDAVISYSKEIKLDKRCEYVAFASLSLHKIEDLNSTKNLKEFLSIGTAEINITVKR